LLSIPHVEGQDTAIDNRVVLILLPVGGRASGVIVDVRRVDREVTILTAYHVIRGFTATDNHPSKPVPIQFRGSDKTFEAEIVESLCDPDIDLGALKITGIDIPSRVAPFKLGRTAYLLREDVKVRMMGHKIATGATWLPDTGILLKEPKSRVKTSCVQADKGFSGGPVTDGDLLLGIISEVNTEKHECYATAIDAIRGILDLADPFRTTLMRWIQATQSRSQKNQSVAADAPVGTPLPQPEFEFQDYYYPEQDWCNFTPSESADFGCVTAPDDRQGVAQERFDDLVKGVKRSLGDGWQEDDSLRTKWERLAVPGAATWLRTVVFTPDPGTSDVTIRVYIQKSGPWYQVGLSGGIPQQAKPGKQMGERKTLP